VKKRQTHLNFNVGRVASPRRPRTARRAVPTFQAARTHSGPQFPSVAFVLYQFMKNCSLTFPSPRASGERDRERGFLKMASCPQPCPPQNCGGEGEIQAVQN